MGAVNFYRKTQNKGFGIFFLFLENHDKDGNETFLNLGLLTIL